MDYLGNTKLSYFHNGSSIEILEENNYYPFGLRHTGYYPLTESTFRYKYNGKEVQENGMYDYGARMYMPEIARWGVMDPHAEMYRAWSPYNYAVNNPVSFIDPDGRLTYDWQLGAYRDGKGELMGWSMNNWGDSSFGKGSTNDTVDRSAEIISFISSALGTGAGGDSPAFQFDKNAEKFYKENYPEFYDFVMNDLPKIVNDKNFMSILSDTSRFSMEELTKIFKSDTDFGVIGVNYRGYSIADHPYGENPKEFPINLVRINIETLNWFKSANRDTKTIEGITNIVQMTGFIGHEINHWGVSAGTNSSFRAKNLGGDPGDYIERKLMNGRQRIGDLGIPSDSFNSYIKKNYNTLFKIFNK